MVLTSSGRVLTNNHVISGATTIKVVVPKTGHSYKARVLGYDRSADVALLQLQGASNLKTVSNMSPERTRTRAGCVNSVPPGERGLFCGGIVFRCVPRLSAMCSIRLLGAPRGMRS